MINEPTVDALVNKLGTENEKGEREPASKYALCVVASKRARQIIERENNMGVAPGNDKEVVIACKEIMDGKITYTKD